MTDQGWLKDLAKRMVALADEQPPIKPRLRLVDNTQSAPEPQDREWHCRMIRHLSNRWGLQILVDQAVRGFNDINELPYDDLEALHNRLHRAYGFLAAGVSLEEAGLIEPPEPTI